MALLNHIGDWFAEQRAKRNAPPPVPTVAAPVVRRSNRIGGWVVLAMIGFAFLIFVFTRANGPGYQLPVATQSVVPANGGQVDHLFPAKQRVTPANTQAADARLGNEDAAYRGQFSNGMPAGFQQQPPQQMATVDPEAQERERRRKSLFASTVVQVPEEVPAAVTSANAAPTSAASTAGAAPLLPGEKPSDSHRRDCLDTALDGEKLYAVCEGTFVDLVLNNRLVGDFAGPVVATLSDDVYSRDRQHLLLPKGTRVLGRADRTSDVHQERMVVRFHRILFDTGRGYALADTPGLNQAGDSALKADKINRHLLATFSTSIALGALAGFSAYGTGGYLNATGADMYRQGVSQSLGQQAQQTLGRDLGTRRPTIEVREGHAIKLMLEEDLLLPEYTR